MDYDYLIECAWYHEISLFHCDCFSISQTMDSFREYFYQIIIFDNKIQVKSVMKCQGSLLILHNLYLLIVK